MCWVINVSGKGHRDEAAAMLQEANRVAETVLQKQASTRRTSVRIGYLICGGYETAVSSPRS